MVCSRCLREHYLGAEKACSHGIYMNGVYVVDACAECGRTVEGTCQDRLHCPDADRVPAELTL